MMVLTVEQIQQELSVLEERGEALKREALPHLDAWVAEQVMNCRETCCGDITRESVKASEDMDPDLFRLLCKSLDVDGLRLASLANLALSKHDGVPNLVRFNVVNMGIQTLRLLYKY